MLEILLTRNIPVEPVIGLTYTDAMTIEYNKSLTGVHTLTMLLKNITVQVLDQSDNVLATVVGDAIGSSKATAIQPGPTKLKLRTKANNGVDTKTASLELQVRGTGLPSGMTIPKISGWEAAEVRMISLLSLMDLVSVPAAISPHLRQLTLSGSSQLNDPNISLWDVSRLTTMQSMFMLCTVFNQPIGHWNISNVTRMDAAFRGCTMFNQPLNNWDVSKVTSFVQTFLQCYTFNQPLNKWNVSNATSLDSVFYECTVFNQDINVWNTANVTNMQYLFFKCGTFNKTIASWNVSKVANISAMFSSATKFNQDLSSMIFKSSTVRTDYDLSATSWLSVNKPKFTGI